MSTYVGHMKLMFNTRTNTIVMLKTYIHEIKCFGKKAFSIGKKKNHFNDLLSMHLITIVSLIEKITIISIVCVSQYKCSQGC